MIKCLLTVLIYTIFIFGAKAQTSLSFATGGTPVYTTPWVIGGSASVVGSVIQLTPPSGSQSGRIYSGTPVTVTGCGAFTAEFEFQVIPSTSAWAIADGIAFWILSPLSSFVGGGGIGLPSNPNGLVLVLDNYDNDGVPNDPLISLYGYPTGFTGTYVEGVATNRLGNLNNQYYVSDGSWHHVKLTYGGGIVKVYMNHSSTPNMTGTFPITSTSLYFGFCGSTGGAWSTQSVRNCYITYDNISAINGPGVVCLGSPHTYTDSTAGGTWSSSTTSVATITSAGVLTGISTGTTTISYVYGACTATKVVTVDGTATFAIPGATICAGTSTTLSGATGTWASSTPVAGTVDATSGLVTGISAGTTVITYTYASGCYDTALVTVLTAPPTLTISPTPASVCDNGSLTLTATGATAYNLFPPQSWEYGVPTTPGVPINGWTYAGAPTSLWYREYGPTTANPATAGAVSGNYVANFHSRTIGSGTPANLKSPTFSMTGVSSAVFSIWVYRDATAAYNTATYNNEYLYIYLTGAPVGAGSGAIGTIPRRAGLAITGPITGTSTTTTSGWYQYTYTLPSALVGTANYIQIFGNAANGNNQYCDSITLTGTLAAPTWSPSTYLFNDAALTSAYTGAAMNPVYVHPTGITAPTNVTYTASTTNGTCTSTGTRTVTMNPNPAAITGTTVICIGSTTTLSSATTGGSWTSSNTAVATIGSASGVMSGSLSGTTTISYAFGGCAVATVVTVVASPGAITGINIACLGATTNLANSVGGGVWTSSNPAVGSVDASTGIVTGVTLGTTMITYGIATCYATLLVSVNPFPSAITGSMGVCVGSTTTLSSTPSGGFWTSSTGSVASVHVITGVVTGVSAGTAIISYRVGGCAVITTMNVVTTPGPITGTLTTCVGSTTTLSHAAPGGTWTSGDPAFASVGSSSGIVTGVAIGTARITYTVGAGCVTSSVVTVTNAPAAPSGTLSLCVGNTTTLTHSTFGGTWSCSCPTIATVGLGTGLVTGVGPGTCIITYSLPSGCLAMATVSVNGIPAGITGTLSVCQLATTTLSSATPGGTWTSSATLVASVGSASGIVTGVNTGTATIQYSLPSGCATSVIVTVAATPVAISGPTTTCVGQSIALTSGPGAGAWSCCTGGIGSISGSGVFTGLSVGACAVTFTSPAGCFSTTTVTVNPIPPPITGGAGICVGSCTTLSTTSSTGVWTSSTPSIVSILSPGLACGVAAGTATVSYTYGATGCATTRIVTVNTLPGPITGSLAVCIGQTSTLSNSATGGTWASSTSSIGTIDPTTGVLTGIAAGTTTITYSLGSGCIVTAVATVNSNPSAISGTTNLCAGTTTTLSSSAGGTWFCSCPGIATIGVGTGIVSTTGSGTCTITYTLPTGCTTTTTITVNTLPAVITGGTNVCVGTTTTLSSTTPGGLWSSSNGNASVNAMTGVVTGVLPGTSTIAYTLPGTGCNRTVVVLVSAPPTSIGGSLQVCEGSSTTLSGSPAGGTWSSACPLVGTIGIGSGTYSAIAPGTCSVTYTLPSGCALSSTVTVNSLPSAISGTMTTCVGQTTALSSLPAGGAWVSSTTANGTVSATGVVGGIAAGTTTISYTLATGCRRTSIVTVFALPGTITGAANVCASGTTTLNCTPTGGTWIMGCAYATIGVTTGIVSGISSGTCDVTYTVGTGCSRTAVVTVNALPSAITGSLATCVGSSTNLSNATFGGTWSASPGTIATISGTGVVTGIAPGTALVSYTVSSTLCRAIETVTVYALPGIIGGTLNACAGQCTTFTNSSSGGTWSSSNPAIGTINSTSGIFCGIASGTTGITYTLGTGCIATAVATVNPLPSPITGSLQVCELASTTLSNATMGGVWSSGATAIATVVSGTGVVTGVTPGTATISYTVPSGCSSTAIVTVHALPSAIAGPTVVCEQSSITLTSTPSGGAWSSGTPALGTVNSSTGVMTGLSNGTALISYSFGIGCVRTVNIVVNAQPAAITGNTGVCIGTTQLLSTTSTGGNWSSSNTTTIPVSATGTISGLVLGTANISYTFTATGCSRVVLATVHPLPSPITGSDGFCNLSSTLYSSSPAGGTWSSANTSILTIDPATGMATGVNVDTTDVIYELPTTCRVTKRVFLILAPYPITGPHDMCLGQSRTLTNAIGGGVWSSSAPGIASVDASTGVVIGGSLGVATITYVLSTGCLSTYSVTVNPIPGGVSGPDQVCESLNATYTNGTPGGTWSTSNMAIGTINTTSGVFTAISGGVLTVTYTLGSGCNAMKQVTVNALPAPISGVTQICEGTSTTLTTASTGGFWSSADPIVADANALTGVITGVSAMSMGIHGIGQTAITYTLPTGCLRTYDMTVNPLPTPITGPSNVCVGDVILLNNLTPGGGWVSTIPAIGTIDGVSGIFGGISAGVSVVSYVLPTGCVATKPVNVHANPVPITGALSVCAGFSTNLSSGPAGGSWTQDPSSMIYGTIHSVTGVVSGILAGVIPVTYTMGSGCRVTEAVTVITLPGVISGTPQVCVGSQTTMTNPVAGGTWSSSNLARATVDPITGVVDGISAGTAVITYHVGTGCFNVHTITVNPLPAPITGPLQVCEGSTILLSNTTSGGIWISDATPVATIGYISGVVSGIAAGTANITYTLGTGCLQKVQVTVNVTPGPISGNPHVCIGSSNTFTNAMPGGSWISSNPSIATIGAGTGVVTSVSLGVITISYVLPVTGCMTTKVVTVHPLPVAYNVTGGGNYCSGAGGVHVGMSNSQPGVSYVLYNGASAVGYVAGTGFPLDFGLMTVSGVYTVAATNVTSGCMKNMTGSATVVVNPLISPSVTIATTPSDSVCPGQTINLTAMPVNGGTTPTYIWKINGVSVTTASSYSFAPANGDIATVTMTSNANCLSTTAASATKTLTVLPSALPVAGVITSPNDSVCQFNPVTFTAAPTYGGTAPTYSWRLNGLAVGTANTYSYIPEDGDLITLDMVSNYQCRTATNVTSGVVTMSVDSILIPHVAVWPDPGFVIEVGKPVTLHATVTDAGVNPSFQWKVNGTSIPGATLDTYTAIFNDYDSISCHVVSSGVCNNIGTHDWVFITVVPGAVTPVMGSASDIRLLPNPNKGLFTIKGNLASLVDEQVSIEATDMLGQVVFRGTTLSKYGRLDTSIQLDNTLANGMYLLTLRTSNEQKVFHFVIEQ